MARADACVSPVAPQLSEAVLACGAPHAKRAGREEFIAETEALLPNIAGLRRFGAASLDLAYVAAGRFDAFWERGLAPWDMAAGIVLVRESGGLVSDLTNRQRMFETGDIVMSAMRQCMPPCSLI
jgi:myo-inositol-1(or 4)-monophosphatase